MINAPLAAETPPDFLRPSHSLAEAVELARARYAARCAGSAAIHEQAALTLPGGNTRTVLYHAPFPIRFARGEGAHLVDVDGYRYVNLLGEFTAGLFGHDHPLIRAAISEALAMGLNLSGHTPSEAEFARLVSERYPAMERLRFTNSGTEANMMAVLTARHLVGRERVMVFRGGYHGGTLYFGGGGSPINAPFDYIVATYNDVEGTRAMIRQAAKTLACILVEPMLGSGGCLPATPDFLEMLRQESAECGAVLIADEVMTSRFGRHGAMAELGLTPDLMTLGKWVGGGLSFGAFGGKASLMAAFDPGGVNPLAHAGTFNNNILTMRAGIAALKDIFPPDEAAALHARGDRLRDQLNHLFVRHAVPLYASGSGSLLTIHGSQGPITSVADIEAGLDARKELLFFDLLEHGYYLARRGFIALSLVVDDAMLARFLATIDTILTARADVLRLAA